MSKVKVLVVDDQQLVRDGIASLLVLQDGLEVVGTAENGRDGLIAAEKYKPDVILMDIRMPVMDGITACQHLKDRGSETKVLMLTTFDDAEYVVKSLKAGAMGYLMKDIPIENLAKAIHMVRSGTGTMALGAMGAVVNLLDGGQPTETSRETDDGRALWKSLSTRERDILKGLARGDTNREIADKIHLSEGTVKNYVSDILATLQLRDRTQAALLALRNGWDTKES